jgi:hypothetical protein
LVKDDDVLRKKVTNYQSELQTLINESNQIQVKYDERIKQRTLEINETIIHELNAKALVKQNNQIKTENESLAEKINQMKSVIDDYARKEIEYKEEMLKLRAYYVSTADSPMSPPKEEKNENLNLGDSEELSKKTNLDGGDNFQKKYQELRRRYKKDKQRVTNLNKRKNEKILKSLETIQLKNCELNDQISKLNEEIYAFKEATQQYKNEISNLKEQILELSKVTDNVPTATTTDSIEQSEKVDKDLREKNASLIEENEKLILKAISIEAELNKRNQKRVELMKKKFESEKGLVISEFKSKIATLQKEHNSKREKVALLDDELNQFKSRLAKVKDNFKKKFNSQEQEQSELKADWTERVKKCKKEAENEKKKYEEKIAILEKEISEQALKRNDEIEKIKLEYNDKAKSLEAEKMEYESSIKEAFELITKAYDVNKKEYQNEIECLNVQLNSIKESSELVKKTYDEKKIEYETEIENLNKRIHSLEGEYLEKTSIVNSNGNFPNKQPNNSSSPLPLMNVAPQNINNFSNFGFRANNSSFNFGNNRNNNNGFVRPSNRSFFKN